jgi:murein L,D-transpeptidase YafK
MAAAVGILAALAAGTVLYFQFRRPSASVAREVQPPGLPLREPRVVIRKKARELALYDGPELRKRYAIALAANVSGDKEREGDRKTPEGIFYVCMRNEASRFHKFMGLSYPAPSDAARGLQARLVSRVEHDAILKAHRTRGCPPWKTALGGEVGIHGRGIGRDWTLGCIALADEDIDELWAVLRIGDPVVIEP